MGNIWTIFKRDLKGYFSSPIAYVVTLPTYATLLLISFSMQ